MLACHAGGPGSIPGRCKNILTLFRPLYSLIDDKKSLFVLRQAFFLFPRKTQKLDIGGAGYRSRYLSHAKRALYHLSYAPQLLLKYFSVFITGCLKGHLDELYKNKCITTLLLYLR